MTTAHRSRRGSVTLFVIVCLLIVMGMATQTLSNAMVELRETRIDRQMRQTELLLEAGMTRAVERLAADSEYEGETWRLPESVLNQDGAEVAIEINLKSQDDTQLATMRVVARISPENQPSRRTQRSREFSYQYEKP